MRQARHLLGRVGERGVVRPGAGQAEAGHRDHDQFGIDLPQLFVAQAKVAHDARCVVLHQDVGILDHVPDHVRSTLVGQVERDSILVAIDPVELRRPLPPEVIGRASGAPPVDALHRLDLDYVGTSIGEDQRSHRSGHKHRQVDDAQAFEWALWEPPSAFGISPRRAGGERRGVIFSGCVDFLFHFVGVFAEQRRSRTDRTLVAKHPGDSGRSHSTRLGVLKLKEEISLAMRQQIEHVRQPRNQAEGNPPGLRVVKDVLRSS